MSGLRFLIEDYQRLLKLRAGWVGSAKAGPMAALTGLERLRTDLLADPRFRLALAESHPTPTASLEVLALLVHDPETGV